jgi:hypothetical protein
LKISETEVTMAIQCSDNFMIKRKLYEHVERFSGWEINVVDAHFGFQSTVTQVEIRGNIDDSLETKK